MKINICLLLLCLCLPSATYAAGSECHDKECIPIGKWELGALLGYGKRTNPLRDYSDTPMYLMPSVAYYGENWFFDNGNLGLTVYESENVSVNLISSYGAERGYFYRWDPGNLFMFSSDPNRANARPPRGEQPPPADHPHMPPPFAFNKLEKRHFTLLGGVETFFYTRLGILNVALAQDLYGVHNGTEAKAKWIYRQKVDDWVLEYALFTEWKSREIVDYYFGVRPSENGYWSQAYQAHSGFNYGVEYTGRYQLSEMWQLVTGFRYLRLANEIVESPLVDSDHVVSFFFGAAYRF